MMHPFGDNWKKQKKFILQMAARLETDKYMMALSPHLFTVCTK
jgi:hypothetical protein